MIAVEPQQYEAMQSQKQKQKNKKVQPAQAKGQTMVAAPQAVGQSFQRKQSQQYNTVSNTEFVASVQPSTTNYNVITLGCLNPGQSQLFPWLAGIAQRYEKYRFTKLRFMYKPRSSTTTTGYVMLAVDYDAVDNQPQTMQVMSTYQPVFEVSPWKSGQLNVGASKQLYTMFGQQPPNTDLKTYAYGILFLAVGQQASGTGILGDLWVDYTVEFAKPNLEIPLTYSAGITATSVPGSPFNSIQWNQSIGGLVCDTVNSVVFNASQYLQYMLISTYSTSPYSQTFPLISLTSTTSGTTTTLPYSQFYTQQQGGSGAGSGATLVQIGTFLADGAMRMALTNIGQYIVNTRLYLQPANKAWQY